MMRKSINNFTNLFKRSAHINVRTFFLVVFLLNSFSFRSQIFDSIKHSLYEKPKPFIKLDVKNIFISQHLHQFKELKFGLNFNKLLRLGLGYSWLKSKRNPVLNIDSSELVIKTGVLFAEYIFYAENNWSAEIPVEFGVGKISHVKNDLPLRKGLYLYYEPALILEYSGFKYLSLGVGTGFRFASKQNSTFPEKLSKPVYIFRLKFRFEKIYKDINSYY